MFDKPGRNLSAGNFCICTKRGKQITQRLADYFASYQTTYTTSTDRCRIENVKVDEKGRTVEIFMNEVFAGQSFSRDKVQDVYRNVKRLLPTPYNAYRIIIYGKKIPVEELVTDIQHGDPPGTKKWANAFTAVSHG